MTDRALMSLALLEIRGVGPARARRIISDLHGLGLECGEVVRSPRGLSGLLSDEVLDEFESGLNAAENVCSVLEKSGVVIVAIGDDDYPCRVANLLGNKSPIVLMLKGNTNLLSAEGVGFCGSRKASGRSLVAARETAVQVVSQGVNVVSGYAAGVDTEVHLAALETHGTTTVVLPEGISHFRVKQSLESAWDWQRTLVVSQFPPGLPWQARNAMRRNSTICALANALVVIEAGVSGGSFEAGLTGLDLGLPVFAASYGDSPDSAPGNELLRDKGARPLGRDRETGQANVQPMIDLIRSGWSVQTRLL
ncbi:DNA-processing protein DprA [Gemmatimonadota bacterium]